MSKECNRCLLDDSISGVRVGDTQCNYCDLHDSLDRQYPVGHKKQQELVDNIQHRGKGFKYDCLMGLSGGADSSWLLHYLAINGLRILAIHYDNGANTKVAEENITNMVSGTGVDYIRFSLGSSIFPVLCRAFIEAGVPDGDIINDIAMTKIINDTAINYNIPTIINGHNFRTEGSTPIGWTYMDGKYIKSVARQYCPEISISSFPLLGIFDQINIARKGIKQVRPLYYQKPDDTEHKDLLSNLYNWKDYGSKHGENIYTAFVGGYYLPKRFGIDKRRIYLSAQIRDGVITKDSALRSMSTKDFPREYLDFSLKMINENNAWLEEQIAIGPLHTHYDFNTYHNVFRRWKFLFWFLTKMSVFPETFYRKYTGGP